MTNELMLCCVVCRVVLLLPATLKPVIRLMTLDAKQRFCMLVFSACRKA